MRGLLLIVALAASLWAQDALQQADAAFRAGDFERASSLARRVLAADPNAVHAHMILGIVAAQRKQWDAADRHFQSVIRLAPAHPDGYFYLGQAKLYQQQWEPAVQNFLKALERNYPGRERLLVELAFAQNEAGHPQDALKTLTKLQPPREGPSAAQYYAVTAFAQFKLNQPRPAIDAIRRAVELDESNPQYSDFLISSLIHTDQTPSALAEAIRAQKRFPDNPDIQFLFALSSYYVTESPLTRLAVRNLREAEPGSPRVLLAEGLLHRQAGRNDAAIAAFGEAAQKGVPDAHLLLGILLKETGDYAGAEREYREAERSNPQNGQVMLEIGKLLLLRGELNEALARLQKAEQYMPAVASVHYQLGLAFGRLGRKEEADRQMQLYRQLEKEQAEVLRGP